MNYLFYFVDLKIKHFQFLRFNVKNYDEHFFYYYFSLDNLFKFESLPERIFRAKMRVTAGDNWTTELADQSSLRFQHRAKFYQDAINQMMNRSDLSEGYKRSEVLALDG